MKEWSFSWFTDDGEKGICVPANRADTVLQAFEFANDRLNRRTLRQVRRVCIHNANKEIAPYAGIIGTIIAAIILVLALAGV